MKVTVLGSGTSHGIPVVGCSCPVCTSDDVRDKRMRSSVFIEGAGGEKALIDTGPEFRLQALRAGINGLDGIFLTHSHADHLHGLDDVRPLSRERPIPVYGNELTITEMKERFSYAFGMIWGTAQQGGGKPKLLPRVVDSPAFPGPVHIGGLVFTPTPVKHGALDILGWEVEEKGPLEDASPKETRQSFLYLTDTSAIPPSSLELLRSGGTASRRCIIIGGLREKPHETHFSFKEALITALGLGAKEIYLTHICHSHSHAEIEDFCRCFKEEQRPLAEETEIHPAWDGLEITI